MFLIGLVAVIALSYALAGIGDKQSPLALPEGSIRGILALGLLAVFIGTSAYLYTGLSNPSPGSQLQTQLFDKPEDAQKYIKDNATADFMFLPPKETEKHDSSGTVSGKQWQVDVYLRANTQAAQDMAKLVFVTVSTALATITGFYFGSGTASTATKQAANAEMARAGSGQAAPDAGATIQKLAAAAKDDAAAIAKAAADAKAADQEASPAGPQSKDQKYQSALKDLPGLAQQAESALKDIQDLADQSEKDAAAARAETDLTKRNEIAAKLQQTRVSVQQKADALRGLRTKADSDILYIRTVLPPPAGPTAQDSGQTVAAIAKRSADAQAKFDALGKDQAKTLQDTIAEAGAGASDAVKKAGDAAAAFWDAMGKALQSLSGDATRANSPATSADPQALATVDSQSQAAGKDFDSAYAAFLAAQATIRDTAAKG